MYSSCTLFCNRCCCSIDTLLIGFFGGVVRIPQNWTSASGEILFILPHAANASGSKNRWAVFAHTGILSCVRWLLAMCVCVSALRLSTSYRSLSQFLMRKSKLAVGGTFCNETRITLPWLPDQSLVHSQAVASLSLLCPYYRGSYSREPAVMVSISLLCYRRSYERRTYQSNLF